MRNDFRLFVDSEDNGVVRVTRVTTRIQFVFTVALALSISSSSSAKVCGDDIDGVRIACACGDVVASDSTLRPTDPVVLERCPGFGLILRADPLAESITLDLGGLALRGSDRLFGILVDRGGNEGATIVGGPRGRVGYVTGFATGLSVPNPHALARVARVVARGNHSEGFLIRHRGAFVIDCAAEDNGGHGFQIMGRGGRFLNLRAERNGRNGITIRSPGATVVAVTQDNAENGVVSDGPRSDLNGVTARNNGRHGVVATRGRQLIDGTASYGNGRAELKVRRGNSR